MQIGDMVRIDPAWLEDPEDKLEAIDMGIGTIIKLEDRFVNQVNDYPTNYRDIVVMWPTHGISWCEPEQLEVVVS